MKTFFKLLLILLVLGGATAAAYRPTVAWWELRNRPKFRTAVVGQGRIEFTVRSTGTVKPVKSVSVGSFVSGPIAEVLVDYNDRVTKDQLMARIDPRIYQANLQRDQAAMDTQKAQVERVKAELQRAIRDEDRSKSLHAKNKDFISDTEMDLFRFARLSLDAQLILAKASVKQAQATLDNSTANVEFTKILAPVDGIVIDKKIDTGQTLVATFQTPELFVVAPDMDKLMHVFASVDEADIGLIRRAKERERPVTFSVDAYPDDVFEGTVYQIRASSTITQNVVTYPVVVAAPNLELKLLPGMTASLEFQVDERDDVIKIPNAALRYFPRPEHVRIEDRELVQPTTAAQPTDRRKRGGKRHVWIEEEGKLRAIEVRAGISDTSYTELLEGEVKPGQALAIGIDETPQR